MNKQILAKTHWNNPNGFHSRENSKSAVCIRLPFPNTQNKQKHHQRKVQMLNPFYFCFQGRQFDQYSSPRSALPPSTHTCRWPPLSRPESPEDSQDEVQGAIHQITKRETRKPGPQIPPATARPGKPEKINVWRCLATRTITKNTQTLHQKTRETEVDSP